MPLLFALSITAISISTSPTVLLLDDWMCPHLKCPIHIITFKDSIVDGKIRDVADMFEEVIGDTYRKKSSGGGY